MPVQFVNGGRLVTYFPRLMAVASEMLLRSQRQLHHAFQELIRR